MPTQLHADTHFSRTRTTAHASHISCGSSVTRGQRLRFILRHVFALSSSNTSSLPDYFVLTTSTYFSTISVLHVRSTEPVSIHKRTRSLEGVWATDRLVVSTHKNNKKSSSTRKLVQIHKSSSHGEGFQLMRRSQWAPARPMYWRGDCYGIVDESCLTFWEGCREEFGNPPEYEIREYQECVWYYSKKFDTGTVWRNSKSCQCSTTSCGNQMIRIPSQTERMSRITRSSSFQDTGRFLVQAQERHRTEVLTSNRDGGISQKIRWYNDSKKQDTLFFIGISALNRGVLKRRQTKVPFTSTENPRTRNSFQTMHSATQLRFHGAATNWCSQFGLKAEEKGPNAVPMNSKVMITVEPEEVEWFTAHSSTWRQGAGTQQFSCSGEQSSNNTVVWKGLLPVFWLQTENTTRYNLME